MISFIFAILYGLLSLLSLAIIASAILSWLVAFDVLNARNRFVYQIGRALDAVTDPVLAPFRRFIPALGGIDITPVFALIVIQAAQSYLLPWLRGFFPAELG